MSHSEDIILKVEHISKQYRLGVVGTGTISHDLNRWWHRIRGKEDPYLKIGATNDRSTTSESSYVWALNDINFEVQRGEVLGIIGKNGAGKSTLLKILSRVTGPTTGSIKTCGRIASLLEVGTGFHPELTGRENIYLNGAILGMTKKEISEKIDEIIEFSGCQRYVDTPVKRYSSGMTVRLAFAVAAHLEPDILIVDEVLAVGDAEFQKKAIGKMQDISSGQGRTVLFVSHNMAAVKNLCKTGIVLENGEITFKGSSLDAVAFYLNESSKASGSSLDTIKDRRGNGAVRFQSIELWNSKEVAVKEVLIGEQVKFRFVLDYNESKIRLSECCIGVVINSLNGTKVADFYSDEMGIIFSDDKKHIDLTIDNLPLRGGNYKITVVIQSLTIGGLIYDRIGDAMFFNVFTADVYKSGKMLRATNVSLIEGRFS